MRCTSERVFCARSTAVRAANRASLEPSVARRILVGKMLISPSSLDTTFAKHMMTSGRSPCIIDEDRFEISHHYFLLILLTMGNHFRWCTTDATPHYAQVNVRRLPLKGAFGLFRGVAGNVGASSSSGPQGQGSTLRCRSRVRKAKTISATP